MYSKVIMQGFQRCVRQLILLKAFQCCDIFLSFSLLKVLETVRNTVWQLRNGAVGSCSFKQQQQETQREKGKGCT